MHKYLVEFLGAFFLIFTIGMVVVRPDGPHPLAALAIGSVLMVMIYAGGHISGAHYNPAVTLAVTLRGKCSVPDAIPYVLAQCLAAVAAGLLVLHLNPGVPVVAKVIQPAPAIICEFLFTFALCFVVLNVATAKANQGNSFYGLAIGFTVIAGALAVAPISGGAFNPAVAIGGAVMGLLKWSDMWIHFVGEVTGAITAVLVFRAVVHDPG
ncbi:MAG: aquaporin [Phycisphaerales bacterium]|nr:aquaporin [Phycisphaerales bacterium]